VALDKFDTGVGYSFGLTIDGIQVPEVTEIAGLKLEVDKIEVKENTSDGKYVIKNLPGRVKAGEVTITRGLTDSTTISDWLKKVVDGDVKGARKSASVTILDFQGTPLKRFDMANVWVKSVEAGTLKAGDTSMLTEKFVLTYEEIKVSA
jgi:phage tail-like protein